MPRYRTDNVPEPATQQLYQGHNDWIWILALSPNEKVLAGGGSGQDPRIHLWDVETGEVLGTLEGHGNSVTGLVFSQDGTRLYSASEDGTLREWDVATRTQVGESRVRSTDAFFVLAISPDGTLAVDGGSGTLHILPPEDARPQLFDEQPGTICSLALCADGSSLAVGMTGGHASMFARTQSGWQRKRKWRVTGDIWALAFTPDQKRLLLGTDAGHVYEVAHNVPKSAPRQLEAVEAHLRGQVRCLRFADEATLLVGQWNTSVREGQRGNGRLAIVSWPDGKLLRELNDFYGTLDSLHLLFRGRKLITSKNRTPGLGEPDSYAPALLDFGDVNLGRGEQPFFENAPWLQV